MVNKLQISSNFGEIRKNYIFLKREGDKDIFITGKHEGVDYSSSINKKQLIYNETRGVIEDIGYLKNSYGNRVLVKTNISKFGKMFENDNVFFLYGHLDKVDSKIKVGKIIERGEVIGNMGNSGYCLTRLDSKGNFINTYRRVTEVESLDENFIGGVHLHLSVFFFSSDLSKRLLILIKDKDNIIFQFGKYWINPIVFLELYNNS